MELTLRGMMFFRCAAGFCPWPYFLCTTGVYINDLLQVLNNRWLLFSDDTKVYSSVANNNDICRTQQDIDN